MLIFSHIMSFPKYLFRYSRNEDLTKVICAHVLLHLLNELKKSDQFKSCRTFYHFFATSLINQLYRSTNIIFHLSYDIFVIAFLDRCENI